MNYAVRYLPDAEQELAALWMDSDRRDAVTQAAYRIDQQLQRPPDQLGESRPNDCRIFFDSPFGILFRVTVSTRIVEVVHIWDFEGQAELSRLPLLPVWASIAIVTLSYSGIESAVGDDDEGSFQCETHL